MPYSAIDATLAQPAPVASLGVPLVGVGKTLASMRAELKLMLGNREDLGDPRLNQWINDAYVDLWTSLDLEEAHTSLQLSTVGGQPLYSLPYQVSSTRGMSVVDINWRGGTQLRKIDLGAYRALPAATGRPDKFFRHGDTLVLYPTPEGVWEIALDFNLRPLPLVSDTDSPLLDLEWHRPILLNARQMAFDDLLEFDKAAPAQNSFISSVRRRTDREAEEDEGRIIQSSVPRHGRLLTQDDHYLLYDTDRR